MERIYSDKILVAIRISKIQNGSIPITDGSQPLQLVTLRHKKGSYLKAHIHSPKKRTTASLQECIIVKRGKIKVDLYTMEKKYFKSLYLKQGQALLLVKGGYGIHLSEDSELMELKNGPFTEDKILI